MPNVVAESTQLCSGLEKTLKDIFHTAHCKAMLSGQLIKDADEPKAYRKSLAEKVDRCSDLDKVETPNQIRMLLNRLQEERSKLERFSGSLPQEIRVIVDAILDLSHQLSGITDTNSVVFDAKKRVPLSKRIGHYGFKGMSRDKFIETEPIRLNDLGLPMHPLEIEILDMIDRAKSGEQVFPPYNRRADGTPLKYLEKHYGKYLKVFNGEGDYLYQFQLELIDSKFRDNLRKWLSRHEDDINNYVSGLSIKLDKDASIVESGFRDPVNKYNKIRSLQVSKRLKSTKSV